MKVAQILSFNSCAALQIPSFMNISSEQVASRLKRKPSFPPLAQSSIAKFHRRDQLKLVSLSSLSYLIVLLAISLCPLSLSLFLFSLHCSTSSFSSFSLHCSTSSFSSFSSFTLFVMDVLARFSLASSLYISLFADLLCPCLSLYLFLSLSLPFCFLVSQTISVSLSRLLEDFDLQSSSSHMPFPAITFTTCHQLPPLSFLAHLLCAPSLCLSLSLSLLALFLATSPLDPSRLAWRRDSEFLRSRRASARSAVIWSYKVARALHEWMLFQKLPLSQSSGALAEVLVSLYV